MDIKQILSELTLEEKASLCSGADCWHTEAVNRLNLPQIMVADGPHGLRKQEEQTDHTGFSESIKAVCFPAASTLACSFDRDLIYSIGTALGDACQAEEVSTLLGPGINMKRSPLCGRNFEYFSEDPYLTGELATSYVNGVQSKGIGTTVKHFAANNQEYRRMSISVEADERTLREIYLSAFEQVVKKAQPKSIMCSYNRINGIYSCENDWLLNKVLRDEWGFKGLVMTDWGAMDDRVSALKAGLDLEMPSSNGVRDAEIVEAVKQGDLDIHILDRAVYRILTLIKDYYDSKKKDASYDKEEHHALARKALCESAVLLKNDHILPLKPGAKIAFIGEFAKSPRYQGGGSSHINSYKVTNALDAAKDIASITYSSGYRTNKDEIDETLLAEAVKTAKESEITVIFAGLPDAFESEGYDRKHLNLPDCQNKLIEEIVKVQPNVIVVLHNGSPVLMPWKNDVKGILTVYLGGQAVGEATVDLLFGKVNPSGKLAESYPLRLQDTPCYLNFPGTEQTVDYSEGVFIGYRYYDTKEMDVLYPFGYGLSYTTFEYSDLTLTPDSPYKDTDTITVSVNIKNTGNTFGKEIVQLYIHPEQSSVRRPFKELKGFEKVALMPGETKTVTFILNKRSFAYYCVDINDWYVDSGIYQIMIGASSTDIALTSTISIESTVIKPFIASNITTFGDVYKYAKDPSVLNRIYERCHIEEFAHPDTSNTNLGEGSIEMQTEMFTAMPLRNALSFGNINLTSKFIQDIIDILNAQ